MRFLVFYESIAGEQQAERVRADILSILTPAISAGLLEDVIFIYSQSPRHHEIIDLTPQPSSSNCPISLEEVLQKIKNPKYTIPQATE